MVMRLIGRAMCLAATVLVIGKAGLDRAHAEPPMGYQLVWQDEFDSLNLGAPSTGAKWLPYFARWNARHLDGNQDQAVKMGDQERRADGRLVADVLARAGVASGEAGILHRIENGVLQLRAYPLPLNLTAGFGGFRYIGSMISGEEQHAQRYGYWEVRLRLDEVSPGQHFAVWLLPKDGAWPPEIDLLEAVGQHPHSIFVNAHAQRPGPPITQVELAMPNRTWTTVGFLWTSTVMRWTVNGAVVREHENLVNDRELYILLSWEIANRWTGPPTSSTRWPAQVSVDYVRIYQNEALLAPLSDR
jgi:Glycosyl hydrolases family 16